MGAMAIAAVAFDAFGTLFDLGGLRQRADALARGRGDELFEALIARLVPTTWHATVAESYRPFPEIAAAAAASAASELGIELADDDPQELARGLTSLPAYPDADAALRELGGLALAVLSNGTRDGIESLVQEAGLAGHFDHLLAADEVRRFKPAPEVYALAPRAFGVPAESIALVSGNEWDVAGARIAGLRSAWISRGRPITRFLGVEPDVVADELADLPEALRRL
jgi:2-haloacid dehalogenase